MFITVLQQHIHAITSREVKSIREELRRITVTQCVSVGNEFLSQKR